MTSNRRKLVRQTGGKFLAFAGAALFSVVPAMAQQNPGAQQPGSPTQQQPTGGAANGMDQMSTQNSSSPGMGQGMDKMFVHKALEGGMAEVQLGQLALQKSSNDDVKQFAQKMVDDHTKMGDDMKQVAQQLNVKVPDGPSKKDKATMAKLQALNGDAFDKAYIQDMVKDHKQDQKEFKQEATNGTNPAVKQAASQGEQVITEHLQMIQQIASKNNVAAK